MIIFSKSPLKYTLCRVNRRNQSVDSLTQWKV